MERRELDQIRHLLMLLRHSGFEAPKRKRTFMEIAGIQRREITISRILAFLLDTESEHGMGELWLRSLLSATSELELKCSNCRLSPATCLTEVTTVNVAQDLRVDVVVETPDVVVGIENKIDAALYNDLAAYAGQVSYMAGDRTALLLTLTLHDESNATGKWVERCAEHGVEVFNVTYGALFEKVRESFDSYMTDDDEWVTFMRDFMRTIENQGASVMQYNSELFDFVSDNLSDVLLFKSMLEEVTAAMKEQGVRLQKILLDSEELADMGIGKPTVYSPDKCCLYCSTYYNIPVGDKRGWAHPEISNELSCMKIQSWVSNGSAKADVKRAMAEAGVPIVEERKNHVVMAELPLDTDDAELVDRLKALIEAILPIAKPVS